MWKYCDNIFQLWFFIHYIISPFPNLHFIHTFFFLHTLSFLIPISLLLSYPYLSYFLSSSSFSTTLILSLFSLVLSLCFFFFFYLTPALSFFLFFSLVLSLCFFVFTWLQRSHSFFFFSLVLSLCFFFLLDSSAFILSFFFSSALSLSIFYFFYLIPEWGIKVRVLWEHFLSRLFLPIWKDEICGPGRENFLPSFPPFLFSSACQIVENTVLLSIFLSMFSISPKFTTTKHSVRD